MGSLTTCWELDYLLERLTNLHVTRPQVHLQGITESSTVHPCYQGPNLHPFVSSTICKSKQGYNLRSKFKHIYPSQRQNLLPTLEILIQNFENFQIFKILEKKFPNSEFFSKISKTTKGPPLTSKGPPPPCSTITKFSFFIKSFQSSGYIT